MSLPLRVGPATPSGGVDLPTPKAGAGGGGQDIRGLAEAVIASGEALDALAQARREFSDLEKVAVEAGKKAGIAKEAAAEAAKDGTAPDIHAARAEESVAAQMAALEADSAVRRAKRGLDRLEEDTKAAVKAGEDAVAKAEELDPDHGVEWLVDEMERARRDQKARVREEARPPSPSRVYSDIVRGQRDARQADENRVRDWSRQDRRNAHKLSPGEYAEWKANAERLQSKEDTARARSLAAESEDLERLRARDANESPPLSPEERARMRALADTEDDRRAEARIISYRQAQHHAERMKGWRETDREREKNRSKMSPEEFAKWQAEQDRREEDAESARRDELEDMSPEEMTPADRLELQALQERQRQRNLRAGGAPKPAPAKPKPCENCKCVPECVPPAVCECVPRFVPRLPLAPEGPPVTITPDGPEIDERRKKASDKGAGSAPLGGGLGDVQRPPPGAPFTPEQLLALLLGGTEVATPPDEGEEPPGKAPEGSRPPPPDGGREYGDTTHLPCKRGVAYEIKSGEIRHPVGFRYVDDAHIYFVYGGRLYRVATTSALEFNARRQEALKAKSKIDPVGLEVYCAGAVVQLLLKVASWVRDVMPGDHSLIQSLAQATTPLASDAVANLMMAAAEDRVPTKEELIAFAIDLAASLLTAGLLHGAGRAVGGIRALIKAARAAMKGTADKLGPKELREALRKALKKFVESPEGKQLRNELEARARIRAGQKGGKVSDEALMREIDEDADDVLRDYASPPVRDVQPPAVVESKPPPRDVGPRTETPPSSSASVSDSGPPPVEPPHGRGPAPGGVDQPSPGGPSEAGSRASAESHVSTHEGPGTAPASEPPTTASRPGGGEVTGKRPGGGPIPDLNLPPGPKGGSYAALDEAHPGRFGKYEVHHLPAKSASDLSKSDGPAILMRKEDHQLTASWDSRREAVLYQQKQTDLIAEGRFREAMEMDIADIRSKFGSAYEEGITEMIRYARGIGRY